MKYVIKCDNGYYKEISFANRTERGIKVDINNATIHEFGDTLIEELEKDIFIQLLYNQAKQEGGINPKLIGIKIQEI